MSVRLWKYGRLGGSRQLPWRGALLRRVSTTTGQFQHAPLNRSDSIRLVEILPGRFRDELRLELQHTNLQEAPIYESLSYEWAENTGCKPVLCGSQQAYLSANLRAALRRLRYNDQRRLLWVDALCIDQNNPLERSQQVLLMREIYRNAQQTLIWLGEEKEHTHMAFDVIPKLAEDWAARGMQDDDPPADLVQETAVVPSQGNQILHPSNTTLWNSVLDVFTRSYFTRTWIIQEIIVSRTATVLCGSHTVDWTLFHRAANHIVQDEFRATRDPQPITLFLIAVIRRIEKRFAKGDLRLRTLLRHFRASKVSDMRDKVFALLGLLGRDMNVATSSNGVPLIKADYTKDIDQVYREAAAYIMCSEQNLKVLANEYPPNARVIQNMPSWVPDWSANPNTLHPLIRRSNRLSELIAGDIHCTPTSLYVNGHIFDTITHASKIVTSANELFILRNLIKTMKTRASKYPNGQSHNEALCRTLIANNANFRPCLQETERYFFYLLRDRMTTVYIPIIQQDFFTDLEYLVKREVNDRKEPYRREMRRTLYDRAFFMTQKGYMGIGPKGRTRVRVGDKVSILGGGFTPFILRRVEDYYTLVGESYIHGIMEGEFLNEDQTLDYERIEIR
ncbi:hypothetical protein AJ80_01079 [Polytolypa hystricis UAMH7299]|uniref:Heterokaryon incompatibility domain-containing protein n=1 Tax=Polytolypa hystricis (strain UAMH7299) TaxID=1447883 RepID=A0A2B7Z1L1_POLH7|nr:hypothetical protein AJ80_01079 [Polytolypa hystricis UAMH7299]